MKRLLLLWAALAAVTSCATMPSPGAGSQCGNPCATLTCPSAFSCYVDSRCVARCQPEGLKPGVP